MHLDCPHCGRHLEYSGERASFCAFCGHALASIPKPSTPPVGSEAVTVAAPAFVPSAEEGGPQIVGGYRLLRRLGKGGMGMVFEAEEAASGQKVAVKLITPEAAVSTDSVERFRQEGRLASTLSHPRCVFVRTADLEAGQPYIVMELMPGTTLQDLVQEQGPLPPAQAVAKILDVIEGLQEAHRIGIIHRDVKPSNCFLESDGRVKVGDFGLSKSLGGNVQLTRTGAFLGTPLYASPEQIRMDPLDPRTDVYSVAATLYFLLTGRAPFQSGDAAATMARIVSDPAPSMRSLRPEISPALDQVVLRGLERQRDRRWKNLDELRQALLPFLPGRLSIGGMGARFGAYLIDLLIGIGSINGIICLLTVSGGQAAVPTQGSPQYFLSQAIGVVISIVYFGILEGIWGISLGKWLLGLRVTVPGGAAPPGLGRGFLRALLFVPLVSTAGIVSQYWYMPENFNPNDATQVFSALLPMVTVSCGGMALGIALMMSTMRARNGYRGLHEFLSGTRLVRAPAPETRRQRRASVEPALTRPPGIPERMGPIDIQAALGRTATGIVLVGQDAVLGRRVWVWLRPFADPPLKADRKQVTRFTRLRWLLTGQDAERQWDAFVAPAGCPLTETVRRDGRLSWSEGRHLLEQLAEETTAATTDGTLPDVLGVENIWLRPDGGLVLLDFPVAMNPLAAWKSPEAVISQAADPMAFLGEVVTIALEGAPRSPQARKAPIRAPLPLHAVPMLNRLLGVERPYQEIEQLQADLAATRDKPQFVTRARRALHLALLTVLLYLGVASCMGPSSFYPHLFLGTVGAVVVREGEQQYQDLQSTAVHECLFSAIQTNPLERVRGAFQAAGDQQLCDQLQQHLDRVRHFQAAVQQNTPAFVAAFLKPGIYSPPPGIRAGGSTTGPPPPDACRHEAHETINTLDHMDVPLVSLVFRIVNGILAALWPVIWILWAFLWRGGLSFRIAGIGLVRSDGRPAARWQCAWRALLFWAPITALLVASSWVSLAYFLSLWDGSASPVWTPELAWVLFCAAFWLLIAYVAVAIVFPTRSLHDYLAGTYLVPR
jgi:hypothetical protein